MQDIYYRIEVKDLAHGIKRWARVVGYFGPDKDRMLAELEYFRAEAARRRGQATGNEYRLIKVNKKTKEEVVLDD